jgi:hypothetical protein
MRRPGTILWTLALGCPLGLLSSGCGSIIDEQAERTLMDALGDTSITVFPAFVRDGQQARYDADAARRIGQFLTEQNLAVPTVSEAQVPITSQWGMNQAKMLRASAADFTAYVQAHPIQTDYALLPEYLIGGQGAVMGIHCYLVDQGGKVAFAVLLNSHHQAFADAQPKSVEDCTEVLIQVLRERLRSTTGVD